MAGAPKLLATSFSAPETAVILSMLRGYDIPACAMDGHTGAMPTMILALGGNRIFVPEPDYDDARALLAEALPQASLAQPLSADGPGNLAVTLALAFLLGLIPPPRIALDY